MSILQKITKLTFVLILCFTLVGLVGQQGVSAAGGEYDSECDPSSSEYVGDEDAEYWCNDEEYDAVSDEELSDIESEVPVEESEAEVVTETAPTATVQDCTNMKECNIPETGPSEIIISLLGVMILGYGARQWVASRHAKHAAMQELYKNEDNI
ncbi:hypothetical protein KC939_01085 [Candidatus Saccharibacteria bacterium]|nr:hypothetical protein [Candidatus Saccharibacteria bacterium]